MNNRITHNTDYTRLFILRHAQTDLNAEGKIHGSSNISINETGEKQAEKLASYLSNRYEINHILASPYQRAQDTAAIIARKYDLNVEVHEDLVEIDFGKAANQSFKDMETIAPDFFNQVKALYEDNPDSQDIKPVFPEGESFEAIEARIARFTAYLHENHNGQSVAIVSHGAFIKYMVAYYFGIPLHKPIRMWIENTCVNIVDFYNRKPIPRIFNSNHHLDAGFNYVRPCIV